MIPTIRADYTKYPIRAGVSPISFNSASTLLCVRSDSSPNVVHIHTFLPESSFGSPELPHVASLVFTNPVKAAHWSAGKASRLVIATRTGAVYMWDGESDWVEDGEEVSGGMMEGIGIPTRKALLKHKAR
jgi:hypothetical protein